VHRVAVALGAGGKAPIAYGDFGKGFVHVLDEASVDLVLGELDTITDFTDYLRAKESLIASGTIPLLVQEEDLLAIYIHAGRTFPAGYAAFAVQPGAWSELVLKPEWQERKKADRVSYLWDDMIEIIARDVRTDPSRGPEDLENLERAMRVMAFETRFARRALGQSLLEFFALNRAKLVRARASVSLSGTGYVFLGRDAGQDPEMRKFRQAELAARCWVVRDTLSKGDTVVGLATEQDTSKGSSIDAVYLKVVDWSESHASEAAKLREEWGLFANAVTSSSRFDEYPVMQVRTE
jgi:hypothetical protein